MKPKGFVTVVETIYHQLVDGQPHGEQRSFKIAIASEEQPFDRRLLLDETPKTLAELGCWVLDASYIVVINEGKEQNSVVEVGDITVRPKSSCRFEPTYTGALVLRAIGGMAAVRVIVYPR